jgi:signal transduction histidine kinase
LGLTNTKYPSQYAIEETLKNRNSVLFLRVLGAGLNSTVSDINTTKTTGTVRNAGFKINGTTSGISGDNRGKGYVQFLAAKHIVSASEAVGMPMFTDNNSFTLSSSYAHLVRAMIFTANDSRMMVGDTADDLVTISDTSTDNDYKRFSLIISSSAGTSFGNYNNTPGLKQFTVSMDPSSPSYFAKILNTDPERFDTEKHLLYLDFPVDAELAYVASGSSHTNSVVIFSGSANTSPNSGISNLTFLEGFGRFDTRFQTPSTPFFISQPFGNKEYDLFKIESLDDGEYANQKIKVSITNLRASTDPNNEYGTFTLLVRDFEDNDFNIKILERFSNLSLNPDAENYIAKVIGDKKVYFNFDVENEEDRRLIKTGKYGNRSKSIRVIMSPAVEEKRIPATTLPFGFRGVKSLLTNHDLIDNSPSVARFNCSGSATAKLYGSLLPPLPYRFKTTRGETKLSPSFTGEAGTQEVVDSRLYWGVKFERNTSVFNPNVSNERNKIVDAYTKFMGIEKLDLITTGSVSDNLNNHKFSLSKIALQPDVTVSNITATADIYMKNAAYIRNGTNNTSTYTITDGSTSRLTFASLINNSTLASTFNKFSDFLKFTTILQGGFDGVNILDKNSKRMLDRATSTESSSIGYGTAHASYVPTGFNSIQNGYGLENNSVFSYRVGIDIITEPNISNMNIVSVTGIRDPLVTDYLLERTKNKHQLSFALIDIPQYDSSGVRIFGLIDPTKPLDKAIPADTLNRINQVLIQKFDLIQSINKCLTKGLIDVQEFSINNRFFRIFINPISTSNAKSEIIGCVILVEDVTESRVLDRAKDEFFSIASHEMRTPLTAIQGYTYLIRHYYLSKINDSQLENMIDNIEKSSLKLLNIVNDFLDTSRLEHGDINIKQEPINIIKLTSALVEEYSTISHQKGINLQINKPGTDELEVLADPDRLVQVLINLIGNALKFTVKGGVIIEIQLPVNNKIKVLVHDTGKGIAPENKALLFHKFQQAGSGLLVRDAGGTGLGLYISKILVEKMGGEMKLENSQVGVGSTFSFTLPMAPIKTTDHPQ